jgi:hypothetical protein
MHWLAFMAKDKNLQLKKYVKESLHLPQTANSRVFLFFLKPACCIQLVIKDGCVVKIKLKKF